MCGADLGFKAAPDGYSTLFTVDPNVMCARATAAAL